jgi:hemoglobin/transferrin/lactoferrin receptor protein
MTVNDEFGAYAGGTWKDFGDLRTGGGTQPYSGYDEWDVDSKVEWRLSDELRLVGAYQQVSQNDAWRTHKTIHALPFAGTTVGNELKRSLDQGRQLGYLQLHGRGLDGPIDGFSASLSYQQQTEERDRIRSDGRRDLQGFDVGTFGTWAQFTSESDIGRWTYGVEYYHDTVGSYRQDWKADGAPKPPRIQGPVADDATYDLFGAYVQDEIAMGERFEVIAGARYTWARADAKGVADPLTGDQITVTGNYQDVVGSLRGLVFLDEEKNWNLFGGFSQGFRAPNLSDLTRFDSARSDEIETPSPGLSPERFNSYEAGMKFGTDDFFAQGSWYWTTIEDMIIRQPTGRIIDGDKEVTKRNGGSGYVQGVDVQATWRFHPGWAAFGSFAWVEGEGDTYPTSAAVLVREPLSRLMATTGQFGVRWNNPEETLWVEGLVTTVASQDKLSTRDKGDTQRIPPGGTPGYTVASVRLGWQVNWNLGLTAVFDNITDQDYRVHGSGINEPGFNFTFGAEVRF